MKGILDLLPPGGPTAVFLDYDGTLVPIRRRPDLARLGPDKRSELVRLSRRAFVGIVSGRPLAEIKRLVGIRRLSYLGNHGLEMSANGRTWVHPDAARRARSVARAAGAVAVRAGGIRGVLVENKHLTASVHFRLVRGRDREDLKAIVESEVRRSRGALRLSEGKKVLEIRPDIPWDKGRGVLELIRWNPRLRSSFPVYIGDDRTDEDAFRALRGRGLTIRVGRGRETLARCRLRNVDAVWTFLAALSARPAPGRPAR
jgi:trehalose-phosphatase